MRSPRTWFQIALGLLLPWQIAFVAGNAWFQLPPKPVGDGPDYENIAFHLARGEGWTLDWTDPSWRSPYVNAARVPAANDSDAFEAPKSQPYAVQLSRSDGFAPTTGRPPLFPALVALIYCVVERGPAAFACVRLLLAACLAVAGALAVAMSTKIVASVTSKTWPVVVASSGTLFLALFDRTVRSYATDFLTEPLALLLVQLWLWCICELVGVFNADVPCVAQPSQDSRSHALAALSGILLAMLIYTRSVIVLWLPGVWLLLWTAAWFRSAKRETSSTSTAADRSQASRRSLILATRVTLACVLVCAPWWIRNCVVLEAWMPLGTQGAITLVGGYSDEALQHHGEWQLEPEQRLRAWAEHDLATDEAGSIPRREVRIAREASRTAVRWTGQHVADLPRLAVMRVVSEWNPYHGRALAWKLLALLGLCWLAAVAPRTAWILGGVLALNTLCVMFLYSVGGRFLVPLYGVLYTLGGLGMTSVPLAACRLTESSALKNALGRQERGSRS